ncbi:hypothetical protein [Natrinema versiforme]|nr:hypothetical protein [Natrinema versiforme]
MPDPVRVTLEGTDDSTSVRDGAVYLTDDRFDSCRRLDDRRA